MEGTFLPTCDKQHPGNPQPTPSCTVNSPLQFATKPRELNTLAILRQCRLQDGAVSTVRQEKASKSLRIAKEESVPAGGDRDNLLTKPQETYKRALELLNLAHLQREKMHSQNPIEFLHSNSHKGVRPKICTVHSKLLPRK